MGKTQSQIVLEWLRERGSITTIEALNLPRPITRLAARIEELRHHHEITTERLPNRCARYRLLEKPQTELFDWGPSA